MIIVHSIISGNPEWFLVLAEGIYLSIFNFEKSLLISTLDSDQMPKNSSTEHLLDLKHGLMECHKDADIDNLLYNDDPKSETFWTLTNFTNWPMAKKLTVGSIQILCQMLLFQECMSSSRNETQIFVEGLKSCKFFDSYILPYTGML